MHNARKKPTLTTRNGDLDQHLPNALDNFHHDVHQYHETPAHTTSAPDEPTV